MAGSLNVGSFCLRSSHYVYRIWSVDDELLYVGVTKNLAARMAAHHKTKRDVWHDAAYLTYVEYPDGDAALEVERIALRTENPLWNVRASTHCKRGHVLSGSNVRIWNGRRCCRACCAFRERERRKGLSARSRE